MLLHLKICKQPGDCDHLLFKKQFVGQYFHIALLVSVEFLFRLSLVQMSCVGLYQVCVHVC